MGFVFFVLYLGNLLEKKYNQDLRTYYEKTVVERFLGVWSAPKNRSTV